LVKNPSEGFYRKPFLQLWKTFQGFLEDH
jgi:hypothetical protein